MVKKVGFKEMGKCIYDAGYYTVMHDGIEHAGYLAFLGMLSLFPFLVFLVAIAGGVLGEPEIATAFVETILPNLPEGVGETIKPRIAEIINGPPHGLVTIAIIGIIWTASSTVEGTRTILNRVYRVATPPAYIWRRLLSILQFLGLTAALIIAMLLLIFAPIAWNYIATVEAFANAFDPVKANIGYVASGLIVFLVILTSYYVLPNIKQKWRAVMPGALVVLALWLVAIDLFTKFLQMYEQFNIVYGSLAGIIATLIFFYILGVIYIFGAEFNYFLEKAQGHRIVQKEEVDESDLPDDKEKPSVA